MAESRSPPWFGQGACPGLAEIRAEAGIHLSNGIRVRQVHGQGKEAELSQTFIMGQGLDRKVNPDIGQQIGVS
jgi:hypothetical protein